jgi:hypothetical protein
MFPRDMVCIRNVCVDTLHIGDIDDVIIIIIIIREITLRMPRIVTKE